MKRDVYTNIVNLRKKESKTIIDWKKTWQGTVDELVVLHDPNNESFHKKNSLTIRMYLI